MEFKEITWNNLWDVLALNVNEDQKRFIPDVSVFLAQAYVNLKSGYQDSCFAIYNEGTLVGFTKIVYVPSHEETYNFSETSYMIDALIIDAKYQNNGLGKKALKMVLKYVDSLPFGECNSVKLLCEDENTRAVQLYHSFGFKKADVIIGGKRLFEFDR